MQNGTAATFLKMNTRFITAIFLSIFFGLLTVPASAQDWVTYESEAFDIQFDIPDCWETEIEDEMLTATGEGIVFVLTAVKDESVSTKELFDIQVETMNMEAEGEYEEIELPGGILGVIGSGSGVIDGEVVGVILLAATLDDNNYLVYIFADPDAFEKNEAVMVDIITSLAPRGWVEE